MEELRVVVVSGDPLARTGLALLLGGQEGIVVLGQVGPEEDWPLAEDGGPPEVVVWDVGLWVGANLGELRSLDPSGPPVVAIVADEVSAREALAAGALAVLSRNTDGERLSAALRAVALGLLVLDESFLAALPREASAIDQDLSRELTPELGRELAESLTPREHEVLQQLAQGLSNKRIAEALGISEHTAKFHVNAILGKLGVQSRGEAVVLALRLGLVAL